MGFSDVSGTAFMRVSIHFIFLFFFFFCFVGLLIFAQRSEMNIFE